MQKRARRTQNPTNEPSRAAQPMQKRAERTQPRKLTIAKSDERTQARPPAIAKSDERTQPPRPANPKSDERTQPRRPTNAKRTQPPGPADTKCAKRTQPRWWVIAKSSERTQDRRSDDHEIRRTNPRPADPQRGIQRTNPRPGDLQDFPTMPTRSEPGVARNSWNEAKNRQYKKSLTNLSDRWIEPGNGMMTWICLDEIERSVPTCKVQTAGERHPRIRVETSMQLDPATHAANRPSASRPTPGESWHPRLLERASREVIPVLFLSRAKACGPAPKNRTTGARHRAADRISS